MTAPSPVDRARALIEHQVTALGELRNASARDAGFKAWRQNTLTVIQRVWPDDPTRAERFRRVPFSAPSNKMSLVVMRSFFEKGCAEAAKLLRAYLADAGSTTMVDGDAAPDGNGFDPGTAEDDFPVVDLSDGSVPAGEPSDPTMGEGVSIIDLGGEPAAEVEEPPPGAGIPQLPKPVAPPPKKTPIAKTPAHGKSGKAAPPAAIPSAKPAAPHAPARPTKGSTAGPSAKPAPASAAKSAPPPATVRPAKGTAPAQPRIVTPTRPATPPPGSRAPRNPERPADPPPAAGGHDAHRALDAAIDAMGANPRPVTRPSRAGRDDVGREPSREMPRPTRDDAGREPSREMPRPTS